MMGISTDDLNKAGKQHHQKTPPVRTIWMRYTHNDGTVHAMEHRVWDKDTFLAARDADAANERRKAKDGLGKAKAEQITEDQYRSER